MKTLLYKQMLLIRALEEELQKLCDEGQGADLHFSQGQESIAVAVGAALEHGDRVVSHHRSISHAVAQGVPLGPLVAEVLGKPTGICGGRAGEMHLSYPEKGLMFTHQLVGTVIPVAAGLAWALRESSDIAVCFHGDAAVANAQWHEGLNIAAVQGVPLLLVCENNEMAGNVRPDQYLPEDHMGRRIEARARSYGIEACRIDGNLVYSLHLLAQNVVRRVRETRRPFLLECMTTRLGKHKQGQGDLRSPEEMAELWRRDPLAREADRLGLDDEAREGLWNEAMGQVREAIDWALGKEEVHA